MAKATTRQVACKVCFKETAVPTANPPFGSHFACSHCHKPLVAMERTSSGTVVSVPAAVLKRFTGFTGRCLIHPFCPWCNEINYAVVAPAEGLQIAWSAEKEPQDPHGFSLGTSCVHCGREFLVEWDQLPLPAACSLCHAKIGASDRSALDPRFCDKCGNKLAQVRVHRKDDRPPGPLRCVFLAGFSRKPGDREVKFLRTRCPDIGDVPIATFMLSGSAPSSPVETAMITVDLLESAGKKTLGREVRLKNVAYQMVRDLLAIRIWG